MSSCHKYECAMGVSKKPCDCFLPYVKAERARLRKAVETFKATVPDKPSWSDAIKDERIMEQLFAHIGRTNYNKALDDVSKDLLSEEA